MAKTKSLTHEQIIKLLHSKLKAVQKTMFNSFLTSESLKYVIHSSRRLGKSYLLCVLSLIFAYSKPNAQIRYASVTQKAVRKMIHPIFKDIQSSIPVKQRGKWNGQEGAYIFPNGSQIHVAGVNNGRADDLRGTASDLAVIDEAAFVDELGYLVDSVLMPQLISTGGKLIMASSSPLSPAHEFCDYIAETKLGNSYSNYTIYDAGYSQELIDTFCKETGGANSTAWRREYLNELIVDDELSIIPEWHDRFVQDVSRPELYKFYHKYCSLDVGVRDKTAVLWAYYDFTKQQLVIEDEFTISGGETTTRNISNAVKSKEQALGYNDVYRRIADNNNLLFIQDIGSEFNLHFQPTTKESLAAMISAVRLMVQDGRVLVNPRCNELIGCLQYGVFSDSSRREFGRSKTYGHFDLLASLIYMVRNLDLHTNPIPATYGVSPQTHWIPSQYQEPQQISELKKIFSR